MIQRKAKDRTPEELQRDAHTPAARFMRNGKLATPFVIPKSQFDLEILLDEIGGSPTLDTDRLAVIVGGKSFLIRQHDDVVEISEEKKDG